MAVRIEKSETVTTIIHSRPEVRNAMDPAGAEALFEAFMALEQDSQARVAGLWVEGGAVWRGGE